MNQYCDSIILIVLGATGDLMAKKIAPALYSLYLERRFPMNFKLLGFARRPLSNKDFEELLHKNLEARLGVGEIDHGFCEHVHYQQGDFNDPEAFKRLKQRIVSLENGGKEYCKIIFYLAVPQELYAPITTHIHELGFDKSKIALIFEKPFGFDAKTAAELDREVKTCFSENHISRIDHYLGKSIVRNLAAFRTQNPLIAAVWKPENITGITISTLEDLGVEDRGQFYETVGAFKDVGENHLLEILALITADPLELEKDPRQARLNALLKLPVLTPEQIKKDTYRAQYQGYRSIRDVAPESERETYFRIRFALTDPAWKHVPVTLEAGKGLAANNKSFRVDFGADNNITFSLVPKETMDIELNLKLNGHVTREHFTFTVKDRNFQYVGEYAELFLEIFRDEKANFISYDEVQAQWRFADPISRVWAQNLVPLNFYERGMQPLITNGKTN